MRILIITYCIFIIYVSFIPFHFSINPTFLHEQISRTPFLPYQNGIKNFSTPDLVSNVLLFIPFGTLLVMSAAKIVMACRESTRTLLVGMFGLGLGLSIELGQVFFRSRTSSLLDVLCNGIGAMIGAFLGEVGFRKLKDRKNLSFAWMVRERPFLILSAVCLLVSIANAYYPFELTLDVSTVWKNLKHTAWFPFQGISHRFLGDIIVENCFLFAVLGFVLKESLKYRFPGKEFPYGALLLSSLLVMCLEGGKVFFVGRSPNAENAILGLLGAFCGVVILPGLFRITVFRKHALKFILGLVVLLAVYEELTPFAWAASFDAIKASAAKIEWVPLASYYHVEPEKALFDVLKKSLIIFPLGFVIATHRASILLSERWWIAPLWGLVIGFILEASQLLQVSHTPSITDILFFGGFSWAGASCFKIYKSIINGEYGSAD